MKDQIVELPIVNNNFKNVKITEDKYTEDNKLKYKLRSLNLIKYNPNLFTNRQEFFYLIGGERTLLTVGLFSL